MSYLIFSLAQGFVGFFVLFFEVIISSASSSLLRERHNERGVGGASHMKL